MGSMDVNVAFFSYFCNMPMKRALLILIAFFFALPLLAQVRDRFDEALDRYEVICARCMVLRDALDRGEAIPQTELRTLLEQIAQLRRTLSDATGEMSPLQQRRFTDIRDRFLARKKPLPVSRSAAPLQDSLLVLFGSGLVGDLVPSLPPTRPEGLVLAQAGLAPRMDLGLMLGFGYGKWGGYLSARVRPVSGRSDYLCDSDGSTSYGQIWTSGKQWRPGWRLTAGSLYAVIERQTAANSYPCIAHCINIHPDTAKDGSGCYNCRADARSSLLVKKRTKENTYTDKKYYCGNKQRQRQQHITDIEALALYDKRNYLAGNKCYNNLNGRNDRKRKRIADDEIRALHRRSIEPCKKVACAVRRNGYAAEQHDKRKAEYSYCRREHLNIEHLCRLGCLS